MSNEFELHFLLSSTNFIVNALRVLGIAERGSSQCYLYFFKNSRSSTANEEDEFIPEKLRNFDQPRYDTSELK